VNLGRLPPVGLPLLIDANLTRQANFKFVGLADLADNFRFAGHTNARLDFSSPFDPQAVPEPASWFVLATGVLGLLACSRGPSGRHRQVAVGGELAG
jgi:hypothetical protein